MKNKFIILLSVVVTMSASMSACGNADTSNNASNATTKQQNTASESTGTETTNKIQEETTIDENEAIRICQDYLKKNESGVVETITNFDNPEVVTVDELPKNYYKMVDNPDSNKYFKVVFSTTEDALLGTEDFFVDEKGTIVGENYRE